MLGKVVSDQRNEEESKKTRVARWGEDEETFRKYALSLSLRLVSECDACGVCSLERMLRGRGYFFVLVILALVQHLSS